MNYSRVALLLGLPIAIGVGTGMALHSILFGILIGIGAMVVIFTVVSKLNPAPAWTRARTRAWEAKLTLDPLLRVIEQRMLELQNAPVSEFPKREREISFLSKQADTLMAIVASNDASPGRGYVGFDAYQGD